MFDYGDMARQPPLIRFIWDFVASKLKLNYSHKYVPSTILARITYLSVDGGVIAKIAASVT